MEVKEAILRLKDHFDIHKDTIPHPKLDEATAIMYNAMGKEIPKQMTHLMECANEGYYCPTCSKRLFKKVIENNHKCCYNCGQRIDYSGCKEY